MNITEALKKFQELNNKFVEKNFVDEYGYIDSDEVFNEFNSQNEEFFKNLPENIKQDPMFYLALFETLKINGLHFFDEGDLELKDSIGIYFDIALYNSDDKVKNSKQLMLNVVKALPHLLEEASDKLKDDKEMVETAIHSSENEMDDPSPLRYASNRLKANKEMVLLAMSINPDAANYVSKELVETDKKVKKAYENAQNEMGLCGEGLNFGYYVSKIENSSLEQALGKAILELGELTTSAHKNAGRGKE